MLFIKIIIVFEIKVTDNLSKVFKKQYTTVKLNMYKYIR